MANTTPDGFQNVLNDISTAANTAIGIYDSYNQARNSNAYNSAVGQQITSAQTPSGQANLLGIALGQNFIWVILIIALIGFGLIILMSR